MTFRLSNFLNIASTIDKGSKTHRRRRTSAPPSGHLPPPQTRPAQLPMGGGFLADSTATLYNRLLA